jgi:hypothetical protein
MEPELAPMMNNNAAQRNRNQPNAQPDIVTSIPIQPTPPAPPAAPEIAPMEPELAPMMNNNAQRNRNQANAQPEIVTNIPMQPTPPPAPPAAPEIAPMEPELAPMMNNNAAQRNRNQPNAQPDIVTNIPIQPALPPAPPTIAVAPAPPTVEVPTLKTKPATLKPFYPAGSLTGPHSTRSRPVILRSHIKDLKSLQDTHIQIQKSLKNLFDGPPKIKQGLKNKIQTMMNKLNESYFATKTPDANDDAIVMIHELLSNPEYKDIRLPNPNGQTITLSMKDALRQPLAPSYEDFGVWDETQARILPTDSEEVKNKKDKYTKLMIKKLILYLFNLPPKTLGGHRTRKQRKDKKSQRRTRRNRNE